MTDFTGLKIDTILPGIKAANRRQAFRVITGYAARVMRLDQDALFDTLLSQEKKLEDSGIGNGVAILHLPVREARKPYILFARARQPIPYGAADHEPVDLIFMMISPESENSSHLQRLSKLSRMLRDRLLCDSLRGADTSEALYAILHNTVPSGLRAVA